MARHLILASASPRRRDLLRKAGVRFTTVPSRIREGRHAGERADAYALRMAGQKAQAVAEHHPGAWVLGADTTVALDEEILGKPAQADAARRTLARLAGKRHRVLTAFVLLNERGQVFADHVVTSYVTFKDLTSEQIDEYVRTGEPFDKAGGYGIQDRGKALVDNVRGSYTNVIGLPMADVLSALRAAGLVDTRETRA